MESVSLSVSRWHHILERALDAWKRPCSFHRLNPFHITCKHRSFYQFHLNCVHHILSKFLSLRTLNIYRNTTKCNLIEDQATADSNPTNACTIYSTLDVQQHQRHALLQLLSMNFRHWTHLPHAKRLLIHCNQLLWTQLVARVMHLCAVSAHTAPITLKTIGAIRGLTQPPPTKATTARSARTWALKQVTWELTSRSTPEKNPSRVQFVRRNFVSTSTYTDIFILIR